MAWTEDQKQAAIAQYEAGNPTPENSPELIKEIAEEMEQSPYGVRMVLVQAGVYIKKEAGAPAAKTASKSDAPKRVSKESSIAALKAVIESKGLAVDDDVLDKLTGKAAVYFTTVLKG